MKRSVLLILFFTFAANFPPLFSFDLFAQEEKYSEIEKSWMFLTAKCCAIKYANDKNLKVFARRIGAVKFTSRGLDDSQDRIKKRIDEIVGKVQSILDMYPTDLQISIFVLSDYKSVKKVFREFSVSGRPPIAFYSHKAKSIYVAADSLNDGILGHEIAHAVINFYFNVPPPAKMQEILAQYVDLHLWD